MNSVKSPNDQSQLQAGAKPPLKKTGKQKGAGDQLAANKLHPVHVEHSYPIGARIDMATKLPLGFDDEDPDEWIDNFSSPIEYEERIAPLTCQYNSETLTGVHPPDLEVKFLRQFSHDLGKTAKEIEIASKILFGEKASVSFMGLGLDPDTINRIIEEDYDHADNVYSRLTEMMAMGFLTPIVTTPFHTLLPLYKHDFEIRLLIRMGLEFYWPLICKYNHHVQKQLNEDLFTAVLWLPEGAINAKVIEIAHQEFVKRCEAEGLSPCHLIMLLDSEQSKDREHDALLKRWNTMRPSSSTRDIISLIFKDRNFSDWVIEGHPSTKKQLDRTIAKVDAALREKKVDHLWSHFECLDNLIATFKSCKNFEQKLLKLTELGYQPCGPDVFIRRKMLKVFHSEEDEPRRTGVKPLTCWSAWPETDGSLIRFRGFDEIGGLRPRVLAAPPKPYTQKLGEGKSADHPGYQCWKIALQESLKRVHRAIVGDPRTFMGGMLALIRELLPYRRVPVAMRNIEEFLINFSHVVWKEHFISHTLSEADIDLREICHSALLANIPTEDMDDDDFEFDDETIVTFGASAHAVFHAHMGLSSPAFAFENMDNRAVYHNVAMMTLGVVYAISALKWNQRDEEADAIFQVFEEELLQFSQAYDRQNLQSHGISKKEWDAAIASEIPQESELNVVERAARRVAANHLRFFGYKSQLDRKDTSISSATGHIWSHETDHSNYQWENELFCGMEEL